MYKNEFGYIRSGTIGFVTYPFLTFTLPLYLKNTKLLQQTQGIKLSPQFYNFTPLDACDDEIFKHDLSSCRGNAEEVALVRATYVYEARHLVIFGYLVLNCVMQVREGSVEHGDKLPKSVTVRGVGDSGKVCQAISDKKIIDCRYVFVQSL